MQFLTFRINSLLACASLTVCLATAGARADELHVSAVSASSNNVYDLSFGPSPPAGVVALGLTPLPASPSASVRSIVYVANEQTARVDLVAANLSGSSIVRYAGASGPALPVWAAPTAGPRSPEGLSVDSFGNVYANRGDFGHPEVWVLRRDPALPAGAGFLAPVLMDSVSFGTAGKTRLLETLVVRSATAGGLGSGDLLVLVNDGRVLRYSAASIKSFLAGTGLTVPPQTLITAAQCPAGHTPTGMALWPADGSLLVPTIGGAVLRYSLTATGSAPMPAFATGLGLSLGKIKTFVRSSVPYAVFDQPLRSKVFEFGAPPAGGCPNLAVACNTALATITTVANPVGLAATDSSAPTQDCVFTVSNPDAGCTLLGGAIKLGVSTAAAGATIVDVACTIDKDPRVDPILFTCDGTPLPVATLCPGYGPTVIPGYLCGAAGPSMRGFSLIKSVELNGFTTAPSDLLVKEELFADALLAPPNPGCPDLAVAWAPLTGEGTIPEVNDMIELTSYCGSSRQITPGHSLIGVGLQLNPGFFVGATTADKLVAFANQKLSNLSATVSAANIPDTAVKTTLASCIAKAGTYLNDTVNLTAPTRYACAAHQAWACDNSVNASNFAANPDQLSAYSAIRGRLANLILTINTRLNGQPASTVWPLADPGLPATSCDPDTTPPDAPVMLVPSSTQTSVTLNWNPASDNPGGTGIGGYYLYRTGAAAAPLATLGPCVSCSYTDDNGGTGLKVETTYSYQLVAFDKSTQNNGGPNLSASTASNVTTQPDQSAPSTPGSVSQGAVTTTSVALSWTASADPSPGTGVGGYYIYRNNGTSTTVIPVAGTSFTDTGLSPATAYSYQVAAFDLSTSNANGPNVSPLSTALVVTTLTPPDTLPPSTPTGLAATYVTSKTLKLTWSASTDPAPYASGIGGYFVYLNGTQVGSTTSTTFQITLATNTSDTQFQAQVAAFDKATPTANVSPKSSPPLIVTCYDPNHDHDCDSYPSSH
jgi:hypothetical protein